MFCVYSYNKVTLPLSEVNYKERSSLYSSQSCARVDIPAKDFQWLTDKSFHIITDYFVYFTAVGS